MQSDAQHLQAVFERVPIGIVQSSPSGKILNANQTFSHMLGYEPEELLGMDLVGLIHADDYPGEVELQEQLLAGQLPFYEREKRYRRKNGEVIWAKVTRSLICDEAGKPLEIVSSVLDLSERKRIESELRAQATLLANADSAIITIDDQKRVTAWNEAAEKLYGWTAAEALGRSLPDVVGRDISQGEGRRIKDALADGGRWASEVTHRHKDSHAMQLEATVSALHASGGQATGYVITLRDIAARKMAEEALRARQEELETLLSVSPIALFVAHDPACTRITGNPAAYRLVEMPAEQAGNISKSAPAEERPPYRVLRDGKEVPPEDMPMQRAARLGVETVEDDLELRFQDGSHRYMYGYARPLFDPGGKTRGAIGAMLDITRRKEAEKALQELNIQLEQRVQERTAELERANAALRESEATARLLLDHAPDAVLIADEHGTIVHVNRQLERLFGYETDEVLGKAVETLIPEGYHDWPRRHRAGFHLRRAQRVMGTRLSAAAQHRNGDEFPVDVVLTSIEDIPGWDIMATIRDTTERTRMEEALQESTNRLQALSQRLVEVQEEALRAIARELHDRVGQSLTALKIILSLIGDEAGEEARKRIAPRLEAATEVTGELITLVRDLLNDLRPPVLDEYGLEAAVESYISQFTERFALEVILKGPEQPLPRLSPGIETSLLRIVQEALTNIPQHAGASRAVVSLSRLDHTIVLTIEDNGRGIQAWATAKRPGVHGLTTMRERAEALGGEFHLSSVPGRGTRVEARVPIPAAYRSAILQGEE